MSDPFVADIRKEWDWVKVGIEEILEGQPQETFRPEDVYAECVNGTATLFIDEHKNFSVTQIEVDRYAGHKTLLLWVSWRSNKGLSHKSISDSYLPFFEDVARDCGCSFVEVRSSLDKLNDYYLSRGWSLSTRVFTKKL
tara:strand:- start:83 stop:499 length:417 start_codon:yes stop_codon:yes gene_type:complete